MASPFDVTLKALIDAHLAEWAAFLAARVGVPTGPVRVLNTDLSAPLQADRLLRVDGPVPFVLHLELESSGHLGVPDRLLRYNVAARAAEGPPVHSVLVVLRPKAHATDHTGTLEHVGADGRPYLTFRYTVVRVWQESFAGLLAAGPGLAPLAVLTNEAAADPDRAFERFRDRLHEPGVPRTVAEEVIGAAFVLSGLRYDRKRIVDLYGRLSMTLEESTTYQWIMEKGEARGVVKGETLGRLAEARAMVLLVGRSRFGPPPAHTQAALDGIADRERLERIAARTGDATSWDDYLSTP